MELNRGLIVVVFLALCLMEALAGCPNFEDQDRTSFEIGSICYHYVELPTTKVTYDQAQADCNTRSGHLMTIADNSTQTALVTSLNNLVDSYTILLGLKKNGDVWRWITGKQATYVNWNPASTAFEDCAAMRLDKGGLWEPVGCGQADWFTEYVCEYVSQTTSTQSKTPGVTSQETPQYKYGMVTETSAQSKTTSVTSQGTPQENSDTTFLAVKIAVLLVVGGLLEL